jgi:hypothetical protein
MSPNPTSPYAQSPYAPNSPYAASPPGGQYLSLPGTPSTTQAPQTFHQPQPYQAPNAAVAQQSQLQQPARQGSMPPPKLPYSKSQDTAELEKADPKGADINQISDVLSGAGIDLRAEEDNLLSYRNQNNSQGSTLYSNNSSFNQWPPGVGAHGAFQGTGSFGQSVSEKDLENELSQKHSLAARAVADARQYHLTDPFLQGGVLRTRVSDLAFKHGVSISVEGLFDKIPDHPQNVSKRLLTDKQGESAISSLQASSIVNRDSPIVDILTLISLAAQERLKGVLEDALILSKIRQGTAEGVVVPDFADVAKAIGKSKAEPTTVVPTNITGTAWEGAPGAVGSKTIPGQQGESPQLHLLLSSRTKRSTSGSKDRGDRLPTPPAEAPPGPQPTVVFQNYKVNSLKRKADEGLKAEQARFNKRNKRKGASSTTSDKAAPIEAIAIPEKMTKKERDRINKLDQSEDVLHRKANETARMALANLGGKKKYSWMDGSGGGGSSTPSRIFTPAKGSSATPDAAEEDKNRKVLLGKKKDLGLLKESGPGGKGIQARDVLLVLEADVKETKTAGRK